MTAVDNFLFAAGFAALSSLAFFGARLTRSRSGSSVVGSRISSKMVVLSGVLAFLSMWCLLAGFRPDGLTRVPTPFSTATAFGYMLVDGRLLENVFASFSRIAVGFSLASVFGVSIGWLAGSFLTLNRLILPTNSFLRYIPPTAFVTLLIVYFGIGESYKFAVVFISVIFFIVQMTVDAVEDIDIRYREMGLLAGMDSVGILRHIIVPGTLPRVIDILRVNISGAWTFLVAAEVIGADGGLGHLIAVSQRFGRIEELFAAIVTFGIIGLLTDAAIRSVGPRLFKWEQ